MSDPELAHFRNALASRDPRAIVEAWSPRLGEHVLVRRGEYVGELKADDMDRLRWARDVMVAVKKLTAVIESGVDSTIMAAYRGLTPMLADVSESAQATMFDLERVRLAEQGMKLYEDLQALLRRPSVDDLAVAAVYRPELDPKRDRFQPADMALIDGALQRVEAYRAFTAAVARDDDDAVLEADGPLVRNGSQFTESDHKRILVAEERRRLLAAFTAVAQSGNDEAIVDQYDRRLDGRLPPALQASLDAARARRAMVTSVRSAIGKDDDGAILAAYDDTLVFARPPFNDLELARIARAQRRALAYPDLRRAVFSDDDRAVLEAAAKVTGSSLLTGEDHDRVELATRRLGALDRLAEALRNGEDRRIRDAAKDPALLGYGGLSSADRERIDVATRRLAALDRLAAAIQADDDARIRDAGSDPLVTRDTRMSSRDRERIDLACERLRALEELHAALDADDEQRIVDAGSASILVGFFEVTRNERDRVELARRRLAALAGLKRAAASGDDYELARVFTVHESLLDGSKAFAPYRKDCERARAIVDAVNSFDVALESDDDSVIVTTYDDNAALLEGRPEVGKEQVRRVTLARDRQSALKRFLKAVEGDDHMQILDAYDERLTGRKELTRKAVRRLQRARRWRDMPDAIAEAIRHDDDRAIVSAYDKKLCDPSRLAPGSMARIEQAQRRVKAYETLHRAFAERDDEAVLKTYNETLRSAKIVTPSDLCEVKNAARRLLTSPDAEATQLQAWIERDGGDDFLVVQWKPPSNPHVTAVVVAWRADRPPRSPRDGTGAKLFLGGASHFRTKIGRTDTAYVRAFGMMNNPEAFAPGQAPTSVCRARHRCHVVCSLSSDHEALRIRTAEGLPLPNLVVGFRTDRPPLSPADSTGKVQLDGAYPAETVHLRRVRTRGRTFLRVFPQDLRDRGWTHISHDGVDVLPGEWEAIDGLYRRVMAR